MSLVTQITSLANAIGTDVKTLLANQGNLSALTTTAKNSLVLAINELKTSISSSSSILDTATDTSSTWSASKIISSLDALKDEIVGGASAALDTLKEIETQLGSDNTALGNLLTAVGNRVAFDQSQTLTTPQQLQACENIGVGDPETDFSSTYTTAKA